MKKSMKTKNMWTKEEELVFPIDSDSIEGFSSWYLYPDRADKTCLLLNCYYNNKNELMFGLSSRTKIRAIEDGIVRHVVNDPKKGNYVSMVMIEHDGLYSGKTSAYFFVDPMIEQYQEIRKGQVIGTTRIDKVRGLRLELMDGWNSIHKEDNRRVDPYEILF